MNEHASSSSALDPAAPNLLTKSFEASSEQLGNVWDKVQLYVAENADAFPERDADWYPEADDDAGRNYNDIFFFGLPEDARYHTQLGDWDKVVVACQIEGEGEVTQIGILCSRFDPNEEREYNRIVTLRTSPLYPYNVEQSTSETLTDIDELFESDPYYDEEDAFDLATTKVPEDSGNIGLTSVSAVELAELVDQLPAPRPFPETLAHKREVTAKPEDLDAVRNRIVKFVDDHGQKPEHLERAPMLTIGDEPARPVLDEDAEVPITSLTVKGDLLRKIAAKAANRLGVGQELTFSHDIPVYSHRGPMPERTDDIRAEDIFDPWSNGSALCSVEKPERDPRLESTTYTLDDSKSYRESEPKSGTGHLLSSEDPYYISVTECRALKDILNALDTLALADPERLKASTEASWHTY